MTMPVKKREAKAQRKAAAPVRPANLMNPRTQARQQVPLAPLEEESPLEIIRIETERQQRRSERRLSQISEEREAARRRTAEGNLSDFDEVVQSHMHLYNADKDGYEEIVLRDHVSDIKDALKEHFG